MSKSVWLPLRPDHPAYPPRIDFSARGSGKYSLLLSISYSRTPRFITKARAADARDFWRDADTPTMNPSIRRVPPLAIRDCSAFADLTSRLDGAAKALTAAARQSMRVC